MNVIDHSVAAISPTNCYNYYMYIKLPRAAANESE